MTRYPSTEEPVAAEARASAPRQGFGFPLPFDPLRLLAGIAVKWPVLAIFAGGGLLLGAAAGSFINSPSFSISASLIKRKIPETVQTGETGQAYKPAELNDLTLLSTLLAAEPLERAIEKSGNGLQPRAARSLVDASQQEGTDIYFITYHSPISAEDAIKVTRMWAEEINDYTKRLQQSDARGVREIMQREVTNMEKQLAEVNSRILGFSQEKQFLGTETQVSAVLAQLGQTTLELENAKAALKSKDAQIEAIIAELRRQSPIDSQLKTAKEEVATLRATYTDENPLVKAKLQGISYLEDRVKEFEGRGLAALEYYTGTDIGNQLFLQVLTLRNERTEIQGRLDSYTELHRELDARVKELPAIVSHYQEMQKARESIMDSLALMSNRLKETEIFASGAPGYWQIFEGPEVHDVVPGSMTKKPMILGMAGAVGGTGLGLVMLLALTMRSPRRSVLECCAAVQAPLLASFTVERDKTAEFDRLWIMVLANRLRDGETLMVWSGLADPDHERAFWIGLAEAAGRDGASLPPIADLTADDLWSSVPPAGVVWTAEDPGAPCIFRASRVPGSGAREKFARVNFWFSLVTGDAGHLARSSASREFSSSHLQPCGGTIAFVAEPKGRIRREGDRLSLFLARFFSRPPKPAAKDD